MIAACRLFLFEFPAPRGFWAKLSHSTVFNISQGWWDKHFYFRFHFTIDAVYVQD